MNELARIDQLNDLPAIADDNIIAMAEAAEKRVQAMNRIKQAALQMTNAHDWTDQNGKPYLQVSGAEKVARLFGISWRIDEAVIDREEDGNYTYTIKGYFSMGTAEIEVLGTRSSKDGFFSRGGKLPPSEIDKNNVKKGALTNCIGNGITRLLGIRNLTWEEIKGGGVNQDNVAKVEYTKQEMSGDAKSKRDEIWKMLMEMASGDEGVAKKGLAKYTSFTGKDGNEVPGKTDMSKLSEKALPPTYERIKKAYDEWTDKNGGVPDEPDIS